MLKLYYKYQKSIIELLKGRLLHTYNQKVVKDLSKDRLYSLIISCFWQFHSSKDGSFLHRTIRWILNSQMREGAYKVSLANDKKLKCIHILGISNVDLLDNSLSNIDKTLRAKYDYLRENQQAGYHYNNFKLTVEKEKYNELVKMLSTNVIHSGQN